MVFIRDLPTTNSLFKLGAVLAKRRKIAYLDKPMYQRKSRLPARKQSELIKLFVAGMTARAAAEITEVNKHTAATFFMRLRQLIASKLPSYELSGEVEADESYFGGVRKGKRDHGAAGKVAVLGLLKRGGKVYAAIIPDAKTETLLPIIREKVEPDSLVYTDNFRSYNALDVILANSITFESITQNCLSIREVTSMESRIFGTKQSVIYEDLMVSKKRTFTGF